MHFRFALALFLAVLAPAAWATACPGHYAGGKAPVIVKASLQPRTQELCFRAFAVMHSGVSRTPLWAAEHLLRSEVEAARALVRRDAFREERRLPPADRAELADYQRSGYDRGHLAPSANMPDEAAQAESFSLANIVPQVHANNAGIWADIESTVRQLAIREGEVYIVTGPAFVGARIASLKNRVLIPTHLWKVVYIPKRQQAGAYLVTNDETRNYSTVSVTELAKLTGIEALPAVPQRVRDSAMTLPVPKANRHRGTGKSEPEPGLVERSVRFLTETMRRAIEAIARELSK